MGCLGHCRDVFKLSLRQGFLRYEPGSLEAPPISKRPAELALCRAFHQGAADD